MSVADPSLGNEYRCVDFMRNVLFYVLENGPELTLFSLRPSLLLQKFSETIQVGIHQNETLSSTDSTYGVINKWSGYFMLKNEERMARGVRNYGPLSWPWQLR